MKWLRWYNGTISDPKWRVVARRAGVPVHAVVAVWAALLENANEATERGTLERVDAEAIGAALDLDTEEVEAVIAAMQGRVLGDAKVIAWERRQPKREREDDSSERVRTHRQRKREQPTPPDDGGDGGSGNAVKRHVTPSNALEESRGEERTTSTLRVGAASGAASAEVDVVVEVADEPPAPTPTRTAVSVLGSGPLPAELGPDGDSHDNAGAAVPDVIPLRPTRTVEEAVRLLVPVSGDRVSGAQVLRAWLSMQPRQLGQDERNRFGGVAKRLADQHAPVEIAAAFVGMGQLAPHCAPFGEPWDLIQLQQKFSRAAAAALNHPALKAQREQDDLERALERRMTRQA